MKEFRFAKNSRLALITLLFVLVMLVSWVISPVFPTTEPNAAIFEEVWETVNDNFYDPNFNGVDWRAMGEKYKPQVMQAQSSEDVAAVINQMLSELKTSHTYFYTPNQPAYYQILGIFAPRSPDFRQQLKKFFPTGKIEYSGIGIFTKDINGKTFVSGVLDGSPADKAGLQVGDQLLSIEDRPFQPIQSFAEKAGQSVTLKIQRSANPNSQQDIAITPKMLDATTMFLDAMQASTQVIEREGKKIGYVHIWSYAGDQYQQQLEEELLYGRLQDAEGFVLDLREGWGGAPQTALNIYTAKDLAVTNIPRNGTRNTYHSQWNKPVVMLVNEGSRSAKELLAYGFQQFGIGPVVGEKTAGLEVDVFLVKFN